jgi:hypothetical protein
MKNLSMLVMLLLGMVAKNNMAYPVPTMGSCVQSSTPGTITVLYCGVYPNPNRVVVYSCDTNDTPPVTTTPPCQCPMEDPIDVYIPNHCEAIDEIEVEVNISEHNQLP